MAQTAKVCSLLSGSLLPTAGLFINRRIQPGASLLTSVNNSIALSLFLFGTAQKCVIWKIPEG